MIGKVITLILCGGMGTRLWPLSRPELPKQFAPILPGQTLFERTVERNRMLTSQLMIAANSQQTTLACEQLQRLGIDEYFSIIEPIARNTAPAIALAAMLADPHDIFIVLPSDHIITRVKAYCETLTCAIDIAGAGRIVTFGITPTRPETGYGYIEADTAVSSPQNSYAVRSFREKPNEATAAEYLRAGNYYWNSGMFCFKAGVLLEELSLHAPEVHDACARAVQADSAGTAFAPPPAASPNSQPGRQFWQPQTELMEAIPSVSIDYAVMEHSNRITVLPCSFGWSDLGSLDSLYEYYRSPESGNENALTRTSGDNLFVSAPQASAPQPPNTPHTATPIHIDAQRNMVITQQHPKKQIALIDIDDLIVVETEDALLISRQGSGQKVKQVVEIINALK